MSCFEVGPMIASPKPSKYDGKEWAFYEPGVNQIFIVKQSRWMTTIEGKSKNGKLMTKFVIERGDFIAKILNTYNETEVMLLGEV